jgi:hypothetical protein
MKKPCDTMKDGLPAIPHGNVGEWGELYPKLAGWMTESCWEDGSAKQAAKLFVALSRGQWVFTLKASGLGLILEASVEFPQDGFLALEVMLTMDNPPWRVDPWEKVAQARRKKT